jgi:hypothetical protein
MDFSGGTFIDVPFALDQVRNIVEGRKGDDDEGAPVGFGATGAPGRAGYHRSGLVLRWTTSSFRRGAAACRPTDSALEAIGRRRAVALSTSGFLGSGLTDQSQKMTVAARAIAEKKAVGQRS